MTRLNSPNAITAHSAPAGSGLAGWLAVTSLLIVILHGVATPVAAQQPSSQIVRQVVARHLAQDKHYRSGDLITAEDVQPILRQLAVTYQRVPDEKKILQDVLPSSSTLPRLLSTPAGQRFMRQVAEEELIYDRLDRVSRVSGGKALLRDLVKLPDGARYAKLKTGRAVPDLLGLLPKNRSGKTRSIKDYKKPTGRIYTEQQLVQRIVKSYETARKQQLTGTAR